MSDVSLDLWSMYTKQIADMLGDGETTANIQVLSTSHAFPLPSDSNFTTQLDIFSNTLPAWGASYEPTASTVIQSYSSVLMQCNPTPDSTGEVQKEFDDQNTKVKAAADAESGFLLDKAKLYSDQCKQFEQLGIPAPSYNDFMEAYNGEFSALVAQTKKETDILQTIISAEYSSTYITSLVDLNNEVAKKQLAPSFLYTPDPATTFNNWTVNKGMSPKSITITQNSQKYDYSQSTWSASPSVSLFGFFRIGASASSTSEQVVSNTSSFEMNLSFASQALISILPDNWMNVSFLREYKNGPWIKDSQLDTGKAQAWGKSGIFPLMPTAAYVVFNPIITIKLDQSSYNQFKSSFSSGASAGIVWGPFAFGGSGGYSSQNTKITTDDNACTVSLVDHSNIPQVIAIINSIMPEV